MIHSFNINIATKYGVHSAIILDNLNYWITKNQANEQHFYDGHYWTYNSKKAFAELFPYMTERQIDYALKKLIDDGIIITGKYNTNKYNQTLWYAITNFGYSILQNCEMEQTNLSNQYDKIVECNTNNKQADIKQQIITTNNKENPYTEKPFTENPNTEKPNTENPQQLNTNPLSTYVDKNTNNKKEEEAHAKDRSIDDVINEQDEKLRLPLKEYIKMRKAIKKPITTHGLELAIAKLKGLSKNINEQIEIVNLSVMNSWQGLFPLKDGDKPKPTEELIKGKYTRAQVEDFARQLNISYEKALECC